MLANYLLVALYSFVLTYILLTVSDRQLIKKYLKKKRDAEFDARLTEQLKKEWEEYENNKDKPIKWEEIINESTVD